MSINLLEIAKGFFSDSLVSKASSFLGESESGVSKAISGILPTVFSGIASKVGTADGANAIVNAVKEQASSGLLDKVGSFFSAGSEGESLKASSSSLVTNLLGDKADGISQAISSFSGIKSSSASTLLGMAVPSLLGLVGKHAGGSDASSITSFISSQASNFSMPSGFNISNLFGSGSLSSAASAVSAATSGAVGSATTAFSAASNAASSAASNAASNFSSSNNDSGGFGWFWKALAAVLLLIGAWILFGKGCKSSTDEHATTENKHNDATHTGAATTENATKVLGKFDSLKNEFVYEAGKLMTIDLPNNAGKLEVGEYSTEYKLVQFLNDKNAAIDTVKGNWFEFTNVKFKTGSSEITEESMTQLKNMVAISKGYPTAQFKIGGYTDNTGKAESNVKLSQSRAEAVAAQLKKLGAATTAITGAKGYGAEHPVATNYTPEGRAQNRRVAVNVKAK